MKSRKYDIIIFGASGFTGKLVCEYFFKSNDATNITWAIAGRDENKLKEVSKKYNVDYFLADSFDLNSLNHICSLSKLIISTVGPYMIYGENLLYACIENSTHYLDLTGEPQFVTNMYKKYRYKAIKNKSIVIHCCGFESIPADIGVNETLKHFNEDNIDITFYLKTKGSISGGTWASFLNSISKPESLAMKRIKSKTKKQISKQKIFFSKRFNRWVLTFPVIDKYIVYKSINSLNKFKNVHFAQYVIQKSFFRMLILIKSIFFISILSKINVIKNYLLSLLPSGKGPSLEKRKNSWFHITITGKSKNKTTTTVIKGGDPGYGETSKFISETAFSIILNFDELLSNKGILTPMECTGDILTQRLKKSGILVETRIEDA